MKLTVVSISLVLTGILLIAGCTSKLSNNLPESKITIFESVNCGCCEIYSKYMEKQGFNVEVINKEDISDIKNKYNIPSQLRSCHTTIIGDYFIEGHVPVEAIKKLLIEKPDISGIALQGMPSGSPGMPGSKQGEFIIYAVNKDSGLSEFMRI